MIYADNAATTPLDQDAFEAMRPFLTTEYGNASQPYSFSRPAKKALADARETIAHCIGALSEEIYFTSGGTESDNWAIKGTLKEGGRKLIITSKIEHHAVLRACETVNHLGYPVTYLPVDSNGIVQASTLQGIISENTRLVSVMMANNEIGTIEPIKQLTNLAHKNGSLMHTDAVQAVGHIPINVSEIGVDMLSASAHKFNGPKGVGFLFIRKGTDIHPFSDGGSQEFGMRAGTENVAGIVAMATALQNNCSQLTDTASRLKMMEKTFLRSLDEANIDYIRNGDKNHLPGILNISFRDASGEMLLHRLDLQGICISTGAACDSIHTQVSHVIRAIAVPKEYARGTVRISFGKYNQIADASAIADAIIDILKKRR